MSEHIFFASVSKDGTIGSDATNSIRDALKGFSESRIYIKIGKAKKIRSLSQNNYYWGVVVEATKNGIMEQWGEKIGNEQAHEILKQHCNFIEKIFEETSEQFRIAKPTHNLTTIEFEEYAERCRKFIAEMFGINIPMPNSETEIT